MAADLSFLVPGGALSGPLFAAYVDQQYGKPLAPGTAIGNYTIVGEIGRGGSGVVYRAERSDGAFAQAVALKIGNPHPRWRELVLRERNILGQLGHPGIAKILDGGETAGALWLAMELVEGAPIDQWCARQRAPWATRVQLMIAICDAVQYAHSRLVVHRDLKPSNILVDDSGHPRLLDFGISSRLDGLDRDPAAFTPDFASPEQVDGRPTTTGTDVFLLGRLLERLLLMRPPLKDGMPNLVCAIPSLARRNLEAIASRATMTDPQDRYGAVVQLKRDLERVLRDEPANGGTWRWRTRAAFLLKRRWLPLALGFAVFGAIGAILVHATLRIAEERDRARREEEITHAVGRFFAGLFNDVATKAAAQGSDLQDILDHGRERVLRDTRGRQDVRSALQHALGNAYWDSGRLAEARELYAEAVALRRTLGADHEILLAQSLTQLALAHHYQGDYTQAAAATSEAEALVVKHARPTRDRHNAITGLAQCLAVVGRFRDAQRWMSEGLRGSAALYGVRSPEHVAALVAHARLLRDVGDVEAGFEASVEAVEGMTALYGAEDPSTVNETIVRESLRAALGDSPRAESWFRDLLARNDELSGDRVYRRHAARHYLSIALVYQGRYREANEGFRVAMEDLALLDNGVHGPHFAADTIIIGGLHRRRGALTQAEAFLRRGLDVAITSLPEGPALAHSRLALGELLVASGRLDEGEPHVRSAYATFLDAYGPTAFATARAQAAVGELERRRGNLEVARSALDAARVVPSRGNRYAHVELLAAIDGALAEIAAAGGDTERAITLRRSAVAELDAAFVTGHPAAAEARALLAAALAPTAPAEARRVLADALPILEAQHVGDSPVLAQARELAASL